MAFSTIRRTVMACMAGLALACVQPAVADAGNPLIRQGMQQWEKGQLDLAEQTFEAALRAEPKSIDVHMKLAGLQLSRQDFRAAIATYQRAISLDGNNAKAWLGLGFSYLHTGNNSLSVAAFNEAIRIDPSRQPVLAPVLAKLNQS